MNSGKIIILNGTSSSGKTSIAQELEKLLEEPHVYISFDSIIEPITTRYFSNLPPNEKIGEAGSLIIPRVVSLMHHTIAALALLDQNVIADVVLSNRSFLEECIQLLSCYSVTFVGVQCPSEELERRELARGDRRIGTARSQFDIVHTDNDYDVVVDTMNYNPLECALQIKQVQNTTIIGSFIRMKNRMTTN